MKQIEPLTDFDREIWAQELEEFVPHNVFDAHVHLWSESLAPAGGTSLPETTFAQLDKWSHDVFPGRELDYLLIPFPVAGMALQKSHEFMANEIAQSKRHIGSAIVTPQMTPDELSDAIRRYHFKGLKPYRLFADDPANCRITDYFPEPLIEVADTYEMCVTLHLSKIDGVGDEENLSDLEKLTRRYPRVKWILAHCARAFHPYTLEKSIFRLKELPNISYDVSAVCNVRSIWLLFKHEDLARIMFGTDNIAAGGVHGNYITWGKGWQFFPGMDVPHCRPDATLVCYESLRCIRQAADMAGLTTAQVEDFFHTNALRLFGYK